MATELVTRIWCDLCMVDDRHEPGEPYPVVIRGVRYEIDLCAQHQAPLNALAETLDQHARKPDGRRKPGRPRKETAAAAPALRVVSTPAPSRAKGNLTCPVCGHVASTSHLLATHGRQRHGLSAAELRGEPTPYQCPECGKRYGTAQGIAIHRMRTHHVPHSEGLVPAPTG